MNDRDKLVLRKIIRYADEISLTIQEMSLNSETFSENFIAKNAIAMCVLQIGELVTHLSEDFLSIYSRMPWKNIKAMRNRAAHDYGEMDVTILWETAIADIPALKDYCENILRDSA